MERLRRQGKVRHYGTSNFTTEQFRAIRKFGPYDVTQPPYSLLRRSMENDLFPATRRFGIGNIVWSPLEGGRRLWPWLKLRLASTRWRGYSGSVTSSNACCVY